MRKECIKKHNIHEEAKAAERVEICTLSRCIIIIDVHTKLAGRMKMNIKFKLYFQEETYKIIYKKIWIRRKTTDSR